MYNRYRYFNVSSYRPALTPPMLPTTQIQAPTSSISYKPVTSSTRLLYKDNTWELQFITTTYEVIRHTVTEGASSSSVGYIDKYMITKYKNGKVFETIYLN